MRPVLFVAIALTLAVAAVAGRQVCQPGSVFNVSCNSCRCNVDGTGMACTRKHCPELTERVCEPGSFFSVDCNTCRCNDDGTNAACTLKGCL